MKTITAAQNLLDLAGYQKTIEAIVKKYPDAEVTPFRRALRFHSPSMNYEHFSIHNMYSGYGSTFLVGKEEFEGVWVRTTEVKLVTKSGGWGADPYCFTLTKNMNLLEMPGYEKVKKRVMNRLENVFRYANPKIHMAVEKDVVVTSDFLKSYLDSMLFI